MSGYAKAVQPGDVSNREGHAAKVYFNCMIPEGENRRSGGFVNGCLNYGYAVLLSAFNREIVASGYLTQLGIWHDNEFNQFNLSCDLMEPLRTVVDATAFSIPIGDEQLQTSKTGELLLNGFSFELADKKILSLLYKKLQSNYFEGEFIVDFNKINAQIEAFLQSLLQTVDFSLDYCEPDLESRLKVCEVKPSKTYQSFLEKLICYINIFSELKNVRFFVFVGLKDILSDEDLTALYHHCALQKISLFLLESSKKRNLLSVERAVIITEDLCEIVENFEET